MKDEEDLLTHAREAKEKAKQIFPRYGTVQGIGLTRRGTGYAVKVNFAAEPGDRSRMPQQIADVPVVVEVVGRLHKQEV